MNVLRWSRAALVLLVAGAGVGATGEPLRPRALQIRLDPGGKAVEVRGLDAKDLAALARPGRKAEAWAELFAVHVERAGGKDHGTQPAVLGSYRVAGDALRFEPRFPLVRGVRYRAVFRPARLPGHAGSEKPIETVLFTPKPARTSATAVAHVYPSRDRLPENLLKFYLHFSAPMSRGEAYRHIHLLDAGGKAVDLPFLELDQELWDAEGKRLTLFFDPGRIKRGLKPREEFGPALIEGHSYTLVVDRAWEDADGSPLKETYRKTFRVLPPDDNPPDPKTWKLQTPPAGTRADLVAVFPKSLDHALLHRLLRVEDDKGRRVEGTVIVTDEETRWRFTPRQPWARQRYSLVVDTRLEDLAGNRIGRPFEVDVFRPVQRQVKAEFVRLPFEVGPP